MFNAFDEIWCVDFEFGASVDSRPAPRCLVAIEFKSKRTVELWLDGETGHAHPPFALGPRTLYVAYAAQAELGCHLALGWPLPANVLDLFVEFRAISNGLAADTNLLAALRWFGLPSIDHAEKESMRQLALRGGPYALEEQRALVDYCKTDVDALVALIPRIVRAETFGHALLRGRYVRAVAVIEDNGIPVDGELLNRIRTQQHQVRAELARDPQRNLGLFDGQTFKMDRFEQMVAEQAIDWPRLPTGRPMLDRDTFSTMSKLHPALRPVHELRQTMSSLRDFQMRPTSDGRLRPRLWPFSSKTARNQPRASLRLQ